MSGWGKMNDILRETCGVYRARPLIKFLRTHEDAILPSQGSEGAVGYDVYSVETYELVPGERKLIDTGWKIAVADGFEVQVRPRSGLALKRGITVVNTPGTIDPDYRGKLGVILINLSNEPVLITSGDRIAQLVVTPVCHANIVVVDEFGDDTARGEGGYGSTGR